MGMFHPVWSNFIFLQVVFCETRVLSPQIEKIQEKKVVHLYRWRASFLVRHKKILMLLPVSHGVDQWCE